MAFAQSTYAFTLGSHVAWQTWLAGLTWWTVVAAWAGLTYTYAFVTLS